MEAKKKRKCKRYGCKRQESPSQKHKGQQQLLMLFQLKVKRQRTSPLLLVSHSPLDPSICLCHHKIRWWHREKHHAVNGKGQMSKRGDKCGCSCVCVRVFVCVDACIWCVYVFVCLCALCAEHQWFIVFRLPRPVCQTEPGRVLLALYPYVCHVRAQGMESCAFSPMTAQKKTWCHVSNGSNKKILSRAIKNCKQCMRLMQQCVVWLCNLQSRAMAHHKNNYYSFSDPAWACIMNNGELWPASQPDLALKRETLCLISKLHELQWKTDANVAISLHSMPRKHAIGVASAVTRTKSLTGFSTCKHSQMYSLDYMTIT